MAEPETAHAESDESQAGIIEKLREENEELQQKVLEMGQRIDWLVRQMMGKKGEQLNPDQLELFERPEGLGKPKAGDGTEAAQELMAPEKPSRRRSARPRKPRLPGNIPVEERIVLDPDPVKANRKAFRKIGEEVGRELDYRPGRFYCREIVRNKYVPVEDKEAAPIVAPLPLKLLERGILAPGLLAQITVSKYVDHLPLHRQERIYKQRHGVELSRQTMCNGVGLVAEWLRPVAEAMAGEQFEDDYAQIDETPVKHLAPGTGKTGTGYLWTVHRPGGDTVYHWHRSRGRECLEKIVPAGFSGTAQCDAYGAYPAFANKRGGVGLAGCWAHVRRKFREAFEQGETPVRSAWILRQIQHLYRVEKELRESRAGPDLRESVRRSRSRMIVGRLHQALLRFQQSRSHLPGSLLGKAIRYALNQWPLLTVYLENGKLEIDNNLVENAIRPTAVGKKNWLFFGPEEAGWRSAVIYSVLASCKNRGIDPYEYLKDMLTRLPTMTNQQIKEITPKAWAAAREEDPNRRTAMMLSPREKAELRKLRRAWKAA